MFEKFMSANAGDFRTRYQGTFGFYTNEGKGQRFLSKLTFVDNVVTFVDKRNIEYKMNPDSENDIGFEFLPPESKWNNTKNGAVYVERGAARQFTRGVSERNIKIYTLNGELGLLNTRVDFESLESIYESNLSYKEAFAAFTAKKVPSCALSKKLAMTPKALYVLATKCGKVLELTPEKVVLQLTEPELFRTEFNDALKGLTKVEFVQ
jgi:hypothetical protein